MNPISAWLNNNRPYDAGVALYRQYGRDPLLHKLFAEGSSDYKRKRLEQELLQLSGGLETAADAPHPEPSAEATSRPDTAPPVAEVPQPQATEVRKGWPAVMDETVTALHAQWLQLFSEKKNLQSRIYDVARAGQQDPERKREAGAMAHRILDLREACRDTYHRRDHYLATGALLEDPQPVELVTDPKKYPTALQNHKRYMRDYKNKLKKNPEDSRALEQLARHQWAVAEYEKLLGIAQTA